MTEEQNLKNKIPFDKLDVSDLIIDCIYESGTTKNISSEPLSKLFPKCGNSGGFRKALRDDDKKKLAYVVLYTTMSELEWPDYIDEETGIFRYYGDNRKPGKLTNTKFKGNELLENIFEMLNSDDELYDIPPFFVFKKTGNHRDVKFLGLAAPGNPNIPPDRDLVGFWRTMDGNRFQNYEAYFTILDTGKEPISREWLSSLIENHENNLQYAPKVWKSFIKKGREGIRALKSPKIHQFPSKQTQLMCDDEGLKCLEIIYEHYQDNAQGFEACAVDLIKKMDKNFINFEITRPWRDGGRDALGKYQISAGSHANYPLLIDCSLEAKCYSPGGNGVGVKEMSRLISRIKYRQFGILITTNYVSKQAYEEVIEDGHPILIVTGSDIAGILRNNSINSKNINQWLDNIDQNNPYFS